MPAPMAIDSTSSCVTCHMSHVTVLCLVYCKRAYGLDADACGVAGQIGKRYLFDFDNFHTVGQGAFLKDPLRCFVLGLGQGLFARYGVKTEDTVHLATHLGNG